MIEGVNALVAVVVAVQAQVQYVRQNKKESTALAARLETLQQLLPRQDLLNFIEQQEQRQSTAKSFTFAVDDCVRSAQACRAHIEKYLDRKNFSRFFSAGSDAVAFDTLNKQIDRSQQLLTAAIGLYQVGAQQAQSAQLQRIEQMVARADAHPSSSSSATSVSLPSTGVVPMQFITDDKTQPGKAHDEPIHAMIPMGRWLISGDNDGIIKIWDSYGVHPSKAFQGDRLSVRTLAVWNGRLVSGGGDKSIHIWDLENNMKLKTLTGHALKVNAVIPWPGHDDYLISGSEDMSIKVWDVRKGFAKKTLSGHTSGVDALAFLPNEEYLAAASGNNIYLWDLEKGRLVKTLKVERCSVEALAVSHAGDLISAGSDGMIRVWDLERGTEELIFQTDGAIYSLVVLRTGLLAAGLSEGRVDIVDLDTEELVQRLDQGSFVNTMVELPTGDLVVASEDHVIRSWDMERYEPKQVFTSRMSRSPNENEINGGRPAVLATWSWDSRASTPIAATSFSRASVPPTPPAPVVPPKPRSLAASRA